MSDEIVLKGGAASGGNQPITYSSVTGTNISGTKTKTDQTCLLYTSDAADE